MCATAINTRQRSVQFERSKACNYSAHVFLPILFGVWYNHALCQKYYLNILIWVIPEEFDEKTYVNTLDTLKLLEEMNETMKKIAKSIKPDTRNPILTKMLHTKIRKRVFDKTEQQGNITTYTNHIGFC